MIDPRERELFDRLVALPATGRGSFLTDACEGDPGLHDRMVKLLEGHERESMQTVEAPPVSEPERIGPYYLLERIGEGGMGTVYAADQRSPIHRRVALKVIKPGMDTHEVIARFEAERQALALMSHPNIAAILDAGATEEGRPYFVMEYVQGEPITEYCDRHLLTIPERLNLFLTVCEAVQHAHQKGIIHRDLKPGNIMVAIEADRPVPKVIDFGVAKAITTIPGGALQTRIGVAIGTPTYMSPEQGDYRTFDIDTRTDVYALGMVLYELLVGDLPFDESDFHHLGFEEVRRRILDKDFTRPSSRVRPLDGPCEYRASRRQLDGAGHRKRLQGDLDAIVLKALEKDRSRRYGSAVELADDIRRHLTGQPVRAGPDRASYRVKKFVARHRTSVATAGVIVALLIGGIVASLWQAGQARRQRDLAIGAQQNAEDMAGFVAGLLTPGNVGFDDSVTLRSITALGVELAQAPEIEPLETGRRFHAMAQVKARSAMWAEADTLLQHALVARRAVYPDGHPEVAKSLVLLSYVRRRRGDVTVGDSLLKEALAIQRRWYGESHPVVARTYDAFSRQAQAKEQWPEIVDYQRRSVEILRATLGPDADELVPALLRMGSVIAFWGDYVAADSLLREAIAIREQRLGPNHPATLLTTLHLADFLLDHLLDFEESASIYGHVYIELSRVWGENNLRLTHAQNGYAAALAKLGRYEEALELNRFGLALAERLRGHTDAVTIEALYQLGDNLGLAGQFEESEALLRRALALTTERSGPHSAAVLVNSIGLGRILINAQRFPAAESLLVPVLESHINAGPSTRWTAAAYQHVGRLYARQGDYARAAPYYRSALDIMDLHIEQGSLLPRHRWMQDLYREMVQFYDDWGRAEEADRYRAMVISSDARSQ